MILDYIVLEGYSSSSVGSQVIKFSKQGYELYGDLVVFTHGTSSNSILYFQAIILKDVKCTD